VLDAVAEEVDHLQLALELVVSYIHETNQSAAEWLEEWHKTLDPTIKHYDSDNVNYPVSLGRIFGFVCDPLLKQNVPDPCFCRSLLR
jgi:hypothetical protein